MEICARRPGGFPFVQQVKIEKSDAVVLLVSTSLSSVGSKGAFQDDVEGRTRKKGAGRSPLLESWLGMPEPLLEEPQHTLRGLRRERQ